jgi:hypothetical protein
VLWRLSDDERWHAGQDIAFPPPQGPYDTAPDGSDLLEILLDDTVDRYVTFAEDYYEIEAGPTAVDHVVAQRPFTDVVVQALNPEVTVAGIHEDIATIGYPIAAA